MTVRIATISDLEQLLALAEWMHKESPRLSRLSYSPERTEQVLRTMLNDADLRHAVFVAEQNDGFIEGFIVGFADTHLTSTDTVAVVTLFFMLPDSRASADAELLVCAMRSWAGQKGAKWVEAGAWTGIEPSKTGRLFQQFGYRQCSVGFEASPSTGGL